MGAYDGAECAEIVGLYLMYRVIFEQKILKEDEAVLYRDDFLAMLEGGGPVIERKKKAIVKLFKDEGLTMKCEANLEKVQFLDVFLDIKENEM